MTEVKSFDEYEAQLENATAVDVAVRICQAIVNDLSLSGPEKVRGLAQTLEDMVARLEEKSYHVGGRPPVGGHPQIAPAERSAAAQALRRPKDTPPPSPVDGIIDGLKEMLSKGLGG